MQGLDTFYTENWEKWENYKKCKMQIAVAKNINKSTAIAVTLCYNSLTIRTPDKIF